MRYIVIPYLILLLVSCSRPNDQDNTDCLPTFSTFSDNSAKVHYLYDNAGHLTFLGDTTPGRAGLYENYVYNAAGKVAYFYRTNRYGGVRTSLLIPTYDATGKMTSYNLARYDVRGEHILQVDTAYAKYTYHGSTITIDYPTSRNVHYFERGNLVKTVRTGSFTGADVTLWEYTNYDNKNFKLWQAVEIGAASPVSRKLASRRLDITGTDTVVQTISYRLFDGYPLQRIQTDTAGNTTINTTTYKCN